MEKIIAFKFNNNVILHSPNCFNLTKKLYYYEKTIFMCNPLAAC